METIKFKAIIKKKFFFKIYNFNKMSSKLQKLNIFYNYAYVEGNENYHLGSGVSAQMYKGINLVKLYFFFFYKNQFEIYFKYSG